VDPTPSLSVHRSHTAPGPRRVWFSCTEGTGAIHQSESIRSGGVGRRWEQQ
jgi:hypothetical protein